MKVHIKLFGAYRKYLTSNAQGSTYSIIVPIGIVIEELRDQVPLPVDENQVVLINGRSPKIGQILKEDDTIAFFPAMAGG